MFESKVSGLEQMLVSGGDERIAVDRNSGRNRYGTPPGTSPDEVWFSSSTASGISMRGYEAALGAYRAVAMAPEGAGVPSWLDRLRARLVDLFGIPGTEVILSGSGTELELIVVCLARAILRRGLVNLVIAPGETGRGVVLAASGRHFLGTAPFRDQVRHGAPIDGFEACHTEAVEIRDVSGVLRQESCIDEEVVRKVESSIALGGGALVHLLDCSKTSRGGLTRSTAAMLLEKHAGQLLVVVDSCQLRCSPEQIRADLEAGFMVMITGSKFAGGPPFSGALLLPPQIVEQLPVLDLPPGLLAHSAAEDWPSALRARIVRPFGESHNIGAGLRWEAALVELERLFSLPAQLRGAVTTGFAGWITKRIKESGCLELVDQALVEASEPMQTIFPIVTMSPDGKPLAPEAIQSALKAPLQNGSGPKTLDRAFHVGQPVAIGDRSALRICLSAANIVNVAERMVGQDTFDAGIAPLFADLDDLVQKWERIATDLCCRP